MFHSNTNILGANEFADLRTDCDSAPAMNAGRLALPGVDLRQNFGHDVIAM